MSAARWGVVLYILAAIASISIPLVLTAALGTVAQVFPEPGDQDLLRALETLLPTRIALR